MVPHDLSISTGARFENGLETKYVWGYWISKGGDESGDGGVEVNQSLCMESSHKPPITVMRDALCSSSDHP